MIGRRCVAALDVGGTKMACGLFREDGQILFQRTVHTSQESAAKSIAQILALIAESISECPADLSVSAVGLVVPGWVNHKKRTVWAPNIAGWDHIPLEELIAEELALPIALDSDRTGYVKGEAWLGCARGLSHVVFLAVGTGIGAGILADGRVIYGMDGLAGAVGWMALNTQYKDRYPKMGCFEAEASGTAVGRKGGEALFRSRGWNAGEPIAAPEVIAAAEAGDQAAREVLDDVVLYLGMGVANLISTFNPEMVVLGGGLFQGGGELLERVRAESARWAQPFASQKVRIESSALGERAGLCGAARIALDAF